MFRKYFTAGIITTVLCASVPLPMHARTDDGALSSLASAFVRYQNMLATSPVGAVLGIDIAVPKLQPLRGVENPVVAFGAASASDYDTATMFIDITKTMRPWIGHLPGKWGGVSYQELKNGGYLDEKGWVKKVPANVSSVAGIFAWSDAYGSEQSRAGTYVLTYEGEGTVSLGLLSQSQIVSREPGKIVFTIKPNQGNWTVNIVQSDPNNTGNYIRNMSIVREEMVPLHQAGALFNPDYLALIEDARVLRFMGTMGVNNSKVKAWSEQVVGADDIYSYAAGMPLEVLVRLANEAGVDPWFTMPFLADDDYIKKFATYVRDHLDPDLVAYVELSNEVWNWSFQQANQSHEAGMKAWGLTPATAGGAWVNYMGKRSYEVMKIWTDVYGARTEKNLKRIAPTQTVSTWVSEQVLVAPMWKKYDPANYVPPHTMFDVLAPTTYFGGSLVTSSTSRQQLLTLLATGVDGYAYHYKQIAEPISVSGTVSVATRAGGSVVVTGANTKFMSEVRAGQFIELDGQLYTISQVVNDTELRLGTSYTGQAITSAPPRVFLRDSVPGTLQHLRAQKVFADRYGLQLVPYEGGQHVHHAFAVSIPEKDLQALQSHLAGFVRSQQMADLYQQLWEGWKDLKTGPFMQFTDVGAPSKWGSWGLRASLHDTNPRATLIDTLEQTTPVWWGETGGAHYQQGRIVRAGSVAATLAGTRAEDYLIGSAGNDVLYPGPGNDGVNGGDGEDTLILEGKESAYVITDKGAGKQVVGPDGTDYVYSVEIFTFTEATPVTETDPGNAATSSAESGAGASGLTLGTVVRNQGTYQVNPAVTGKGMEVASINPTAATGKALGANSDTPVYSVHFAKQQAVIGGNRYTVNYWNTNENRNDRVGSALGTSALSTALQFGDLVVGPTTIVGTDFADTMTGRNQNDVFHGGAGNDRLIGDSGLDVLRGGAGNDYIDGGRGRDTIELEGTLGEYRITKKNDGVEISGPEGTDTVKAVELVQFLGSNALIKIEDWLAQRNGSDPVAAEVQPVQPNDFEQTFNLIRGVSEYQAEALFGEGVMIYAINRYAATGKELGVTGTTPAYHVFRNNTQVTIDGVSVRPDYWSTNENKKTQSSTNTLTDSAVTTALRFGDIVFGAALMKGTELADDLRGREQADSFDPGLGNDIVLGGAGEDTLYLNGVQADYTVIKVQDWHQYIVAGPDGNDRVSDIEFLYFKGDGTKVPLADVLRSSSSSGAVLGAVLIDGREFVEREVDYGQFVEF